MTRIERALIFMGILATEDESRYLSWADEWLDEHEERRERSFGATTNAFLLGWAVGIMSAAALIVAAQVMA